jgi:hypothetical protein
MGGREGVRCERGSKIVITIIFAVVAFRNFFFFFEKVVDEGRRGFGYEVFPTLNKLNCEES